MLRTKLGQRLEEKVSWRRVVKHKDMLHENGPGSICQNLPGKGGVARRLPLDKLVDEGMVRSFISHVIFGISSSEMHLHPSVSN